MMKKDSEAVIIIAALVVVVATIAIISGIGLENAGCGSQTFLASGKKLFSRKVEMKNALKLFGLVTGFGLLVAVLLPVHVKIMTLVAEAVKL